MLLYPKKIVLLMCICTVPTMNCLVSVYSKVYLETEDESWSARPTKNLMRRLHSQDSARWIAAFDGGRISVGDPVSSFTSSDALFVPSWFLEFIGLEDGAQVELAFEKSEALPKATRLSFKVIGDIPGDVDVRDLLEEPLSQLGVLEVGQMIPIPIIDGLLLLQECEPENVVFLDGEADLEIENESRVTTPSASSDSDSAAASQQTLDQDYQTPFTQVEEIDFSSMLPPTTPAPSGFVPFQGVGRRLGGR
jgi:hypothetical protein